MGHPVSIAALPATAGADRSGPNPESAPDSTLFALLMAEAGLPFAAAEVPTLDGFDGVFEPRTPIDSGPPSDHIPYALLEETNPGEILLGERIRPPWAPASTPPSILDAPGSDTGPIPPSGKASVPTMEAAPDEVLSTPDLETEPPRERGLDRGTRLPAEPRPADAELFSTGVARPDRPSDPTLDLGSGPKTMKLSDLDLENFGVKRIEIQVEHVNRNPSGPNTGGETIPNGESIERAMPRPVDAPPEPKGPALPTETFRSDGDPLRPSEAGRRGHMPDALEEAAPASFGSGNGESAGGRATSESEWDAVFGARSMRSGQAEPDVHLEVTVEAGADVPDVPPDTTRPAGDFRPEPREIGSIGGDRRVLAPQPPKPLDLPTLTPEPARRVLMMVGDGENQVQVLVHESDGDVSVRFDAPHAIRAHLEASAHQLAESMSREHVSLLGMTFSGPSSGNDPRSNPRHMTRPDRNKAASPVPADDVLILGPGLEFAGHGSRVRIRV